MTSYCPSEPLKAGLSNELSDISTAAVRPIVNTVVRSSMAAPSSNSSGAMNRDEPAMRPIELVKDPHVIAVEVYDMHLAPTKVIDHCPVIKVIGDPAQPRQLPMKVVHLRHQMPDFTHAQTPDSIKTASISSPSAQSYTSIGPQSDSTT